MNCITKYSSMTSRVVNCTTLWPFVPHTNLYPWGTHFVPHLDFFLLHYRWIIFEQKLKNHAKNLLPAAAGVRNCSKKLSKTDRLSLRKEPLLWKNRLNCGRWAYSEKPDDDLDSDNVFPVNGLPIIEFVE